MHRSPLLQYLNNSALPTPHPTMSYPPRKATSQLLLTTKTSWIILPPSIPILLTKKEEPIRNQNKAKNKYIIKILMRILINLLIKLKIHIKVRKYIRIISLKMRETNKYKTYLKI